MTLNQIVNQLKGQLIKIVSHLALAVSCAQLPTLWTTRCQVDWLIRFLNDQDWRSLGAQGKAPTHLSPITICGDPDRNSVLSGRSGPYSPRPTQLSVSCPRAFWSDSHHSHSDCRSFGQFRFRILQTLQFVLSYLSLFSSFYCAAYFTEILAILCFFRSLGGAFGLNNLIR